MNALGQPVRLTTFLGAELFLDPIRVPINTRTGLHRPHHSGPPRCVPVRLTGSGPPKVLQSELLWCLHRLSFLLGSLACVTSAKPVSSYREGAV